MSNIAKRRYSKLLWPITVALLLVMSTITGFYLLPQWAYYGVLVILLAQVSFLYGGFRKVLPLMVAFILVCAISIIINSPPTFFNAWHRLLAFIILIGAVGPLFCGGGVGDFKVRLFDSIMTVCIMMSVGSLICYFLGINFFVRNDELLEIEAGHFSGLYNHSMTLGPMSGLASIYMLCVFLNKKKSKLFFLLVLIACISSTLLSASRAAIGACFFGLIVSYMRFYKGRLSRGVIIGLAITALLALTFPIWSSLTDFVIQKQEASINRGEGLLLTRQEMYSDRIQEIRTHPLLGVGFCCVDPVISAVNLQNGKVEPGTSWLGVFSMTGILGFFLFFSLFFKSIHISRAICDLKRSALFVGCLAFFFLHLLFEGYVLAAGNMLGLIFWLLIGCIIAFDGRQMH